MLKITPAIALNCVYICNECCVTFCENWNSAMFRASDRIKVTMKKHTPFDEINWMNVQCCFHNNLMICTQRKKYSNEMKKTKCQCIRHKHIDAGWNHILKYSKRIFTVFYFILSRLFLGKREKKKNIHTGKNMEIEKKKNLLQAAQWMLMRKYVEGARKVWMYFSDKTQFFFPFHRCLVFKLQNRKKDIWNITSMLTFSMNFNRSFVLIPKIENRIKILNGIFREFFRFFFSSSTAASFTFISFFIHNFI